MRALLLAVLLVLAQAGAGRAAVADLVVLVSCDGMRGEAVLRTDVPHLKLLCAAGSWTDRAETIDPSLTLPAHATLLTGQGVARTGVRWNYQAEGRAHRCLVPNVFTLLGRQRFVTSAFYNKQKLALLTDAAVMDRNVFCSWDPRKSAARAAEYLATGRGDFVFVHLAEPDSAGHAEGWGTPGYWAAVRAADAAVGVLLKALYDARRTARTLIIVTSDHGGTGKKHGGTSPDEVLIPMILAGNMVRTGRLPDGVRLQDAVPTAMWALGARLPPDLEGRALTEAFLPTAKRAAASIAASAATAVTTGR